MTVADRRDAFRSNRVIFSVLFGLYLIAHHWYLYQATSGGPWFIIPVVGFILVLWPHKAIILGIAVALHFFQALIMTPTGSNHTFLSLLMTLGLGIARYTPA